MIARILSVYWVIGSQFWACKSRRQSSLDCWHPETYALSTPSMNHFCLWCSEVNCWQEQIHKFKTEHLLIWQKYLDKYQVLWPSSTSKYQVLLNFKRSSTSKYQVLDNSHQVPSTSTLLDPNPELGSWNLSSSKTRTYPFCIVNIMAADVLVTQGARALAAMVLTWLNWDNSVPAC